MTATIPFYDLLGRQYPLYLQIAGLSEQQMPADQIRETRRAFMGACGQMLALLREDLAAIEDEDRCVKILENMEQQVIAFFKAEDGE